MSKLIRPACNFTWTSWDAYVSFLIYVRLVLVNYTKLYVNCFSEFTNCKFTKTATTWHVTVY